MENINNINRFTVSGGLSLNRIVYFVAVIEAGSFTRAADRLGITKAVVSQQIARLEADFRTALLIRTTRSVRMTEAGQAFYYRCSLILKEAENAFSELSASASEPTGILRLTSPFDYGTGVIVPALASFTEKYPACKAEIHFSDEIQELNTSQFDLAIRVGWLKEQHLQVRKLGTFRQSLVCSPRWEKSISTVSSPEELSGLPFIANTALRDPTRLELSRGLLERRVISVQASLFFNATLAVREATLNGAGLSVLPDYVVSGDLLSGRLIEVIPEWYLPGGDICAVYPTTSYRPAKVRAFIDILTDSLSPSDLPES